MATLNDKTIARFPITSTDDHDTDPIFRGRILEDGTIVHWDGIIIGKCQIKCGVSHMDQIWDLKEMLTQCDFEEYKGALAAYKKVLRRKTCPQTRRGRLWATFKVLKNS